MGKNVLVTNGIHWIGLENLEILSPSGEAIDEKLKKQSYNQVENARKANLITINLR